MGEAEGGSLTYHLFFITAVLLPNTNLVYEITGKSLNSIEILDVGLRLSFDRSSYCLLYGRTSDKGDFMTGSEGLCNKGLLIYVYSF